MPENEAPTPPAPAIKQRQSASQRRAAEFSRGANRQAELKQEAAERRLVRAQREAETGPIVLGRTATQRRLNPR